MKKMTAHEIVALFPRSKISLPEKNEYVVLPGFCDVHVHYREPGFSYKETILTGCQSAARGGFIAVCTMPNLNPTPDDLESLNKQLAIIERDATIGVYPYATITKGQKGETLSAMEETAPYSIAYSDDGRGVQTDELMAEAMKKAKELDKIIVAHCEVNALLKGGYIHDGSYARKHAHKGICSASEYEQIARDLSLVEKIGCKYHVCHVSTKEGVALLREAKKKGLDVSCETAPHYLVMDENDLQEDGRFKMNPPLRAKEDREALIEGIIDGTIDVIATDHAPHSLEEKSKGLSSSAFGVVGLETAFPVLYTHLVKKGIITLEKLLELLSTNPKKRFGIKDQGYSVWALDERFTVNPAKFLSKGKATPFEGWELFAVNYLTVREGKIIYEKAN